MADTRTSEVGATIALLNIGSRNDASLVRDFFLSCKSTKLQLVGFLRNVVASVV
jgi:hypothetical protein